MHIYLSKYTARNFTTFMANVEVKSNTTKSQKKE